MKKIILILLVVVLIILSADLALSLGEKTVHLPFNGEGGLLPVFYSEFVIQLLATLFLLWVIKKFAWTKLQVVLEERQANINKNISEAEQARLSVKSLESEKQEELKEISFKKSDILKTAMDRAKEQEANLIGEAKQRSKNLLEKAQEEAQREKESVQDDLSKELASISIEFVKKFMFEEITEEQEQRLIKQATAKVSHE